MAILPLSANASASCKPIAVFSLFVTAKLARQVKRAYLIKLQYLKKVPTTDASAGTSPNGYSSKYLHDLGVADLDTESVQEVFMQAASVFKRLVPTSEACSNESVARGPVSPPQALHCYQYFWKSPLHNEEKK